jgi:hypothetical protein
VGTVTGPRPADWSADPCVCGDPRAAHKLGPRPSWPATGRAYGRCTGCDCAGFDIDADALAAAEAAVRAERTAGVAEVLANPRIGARRTRAGADTRESAWTVPGDAERAAEIEQDAAERAELDREAAAELDDYAERVPLTAEPAADAKRRAIASTPLATLRERAGNLDIPGAQDMSRDELVAELVKRSPIGSAVWSDRALGRDYPEPRSIAPDAWTRTGVYLGELRDV